MFQIEKLLIVLEVKIERNSFSTESKFVDTALTASGNSHLEIYSCKYSKGKYMQHQLMAVVLLKEYLKTYYRSIVELVQLMDSVRAKKAKVEL
ncbi:MAG: transposase IS4 family protein [Methanolobus sp. T82-4]|jgi:hypothetical protein|nr:MAG: transposase IS4 family protein [Methanolobus sp. T82-4]